MDKFHEILQNCHTSYNEAYHVFNFKTVESISSDLRDCQDYETRNFSEFKSSLDIDNLIDNWHNAISDLAEEYLDCHSFICKAVSCFSIDNNFDKGKVEKLRSLFGETNAMFEKCSKTCLGSEICSCLEKQYFKFSTHFLSKYRCVGNNKVEDLINKKIFEFVEVFAHYLKVDGYHEDLNCVNIMRIMEIVSLMKPSQSSTERAMSHVAKQLKTDLNQKFRFKKKMIHLNR